MTYPQNPNPALMFTADSQQDLETQHGARVESAPSNRSADSG